MGSKHSLIYASLLIVCMVLVFVACSPNTPGQGTSKARIIKTVAVYASVVATDSDSPTVPAGTLLYHADWSHGLAGWQGTGWNVKQGLLMTTSDSTVTITVPYQPKVSNYAIEVQIQITKLFHKVGGYFSIFSTRASGHDGFQAGTSTFMEPGPRPNGSHPQAQIYTDPASSMNAGDGRPIDYEPLANWHTYRIEVQGNLATFYIDGAQVDSTSSTTPTFSPGPLGITCSQAILSIKDYRIMAL